MPTLEEYVNDSWLIDTHEHTVPEEDRLKEGSDPFRVFLAQYFSSDIISAGLSVEDYAKVMNPKVSVHERWKTVEPYWQRTKNTSYYESIKIAAKDLYGIDEINDRTIGKLAEEMKARNKKGLYKWILKDMSKVEMAILDSITDEVNVDKEFFFPVVRLEDFTVIRGREDVKRVGRRLNMPIHSLRDFERALEFRIESIIDKIAAFKIALAYKRDIYFEKVTFNDAEKTFNKIMSSKDTYFRITRPDGVRVTVPDEISLEEGRYLQDYMVHRILQLAAKHSLPVQVHTGLQEGNLNLVSNSNPLLLANLFMDYNDVVFDVFHGSYPYVKEVATLAKNLPNVYIDMCWLHIISPYTAKEALSDWLDLVPASKILGFGGDYKMVEGTYGHSKIARRNIAQVLRSKVDGGQFTEDEARKIAGMLLRENALEVFKKRRI